MWRIRQFFESIKNLIVWFPAIWKDRQWNFAFIEELLLHKLILMRNYHEKRKFFVNVENEIKWMNRAIYLLSMVTKSSYWEDNYDGKYPSKNGLEMASIELMENYKEKAKDMQYYGDFWEQKARRLFWKIFVWRYEYWWD